MRRSRFRFLVAAGVLCTATVVAGSASALPGHPVAISKRGGHTLQVEVRGTITGLVQPTPTTNGSITVRAAGATNPAPNGYEWTCVVGKRNKRITRFKVNDRVKVRCHNVGMTALKLKMIRKRDRGDKVRVHAIGAVEGFTAASGATPGTVKVNTGVANQPPVECVVTSRTRVIGNPAVGGSAKVFCRSRRGVLTAVHVVERPVIAWAKGPLVINVDNSVTVAGVTCAVPAGKMLPAAGTMVRIICRGTPLKLVRIWRIPAGHPKMK